MKTLEEFQTWLEKIRQQDEEEQLPFVWEIMRSPYVDYHYSLMKDKNLSERFRSDLRSRFDEHHEAGEVLFLSKLDNNEDVDFHAEIIFMLGKISNNKKGGVHRNQTLQYARKLALSPDTYTRDRAIIVLGWIGGMADIPLLSDRLLNDPDSKCRAWASSAFMQMWFRRKSEKLVGKVLPSLFQSIRQEKDYFALGCMISVVQELTKKRFGLSQASVDDVDADRIMMAKEKAERFFGKLYPEG